MEEIKKLIDQKNQEIWKEEEQKEKLLLTKLNKFSSEFEKAIAQLLHIHLNWFAD